MRSSIKYTRRPIVWYNRDIIMTDETNYTKREIDYHFEAINEKLDLILAQTTRTNGRVTKCEENIGILKTSGRVANWAFGLTIPIILSMTVWIFFNQLQSLKEDMERHEREADSKIDILYNQFNIK